MSDRSLSRALGAIAAVAALSLATAGSALAMPARPDIGTPVASGNVTSGTDVAAPDQQNPIPAPVQPKVAPAPTWPLHPQTLTPVSTSSPSVDNTGFQWGDAGIGAGGALLVIVAGFGGVMVLRRRSVSDPPLAA